MKLPQKVFSPGIWWCGFRVKRSGSSARALQMNSYGVSPRRRFRAFGVVGNGGTLGALGDGLQVDAEAACQVPQARLTMLDRAANRLCRAGAPVKNLAHSASFHASEKTAPSKPGIKQLVEISKGELFAAGMRLLNDRKARKADERCADVIVVPNVPVGVPKSRETEAEVREGSGWIPV